MNALIGLKTITLPLLITLTLLCFALSPPLKAVDCPTACGSGGNAAVGFNALDSVTTGINNTAVGTGALTDDTGGDYNVAVGNGALQSNTTGFQNMAIGAEALANNIVGNFNMGVGFRALFMNTGSRNSAVGAAALRNNAGASDNTAIGSQAMKENTTGEDNTAIGAGALAENTIAQKNTATGSQALLSNTSGSFNTAIGASALFRNTTASFNVAVGVSALANSTGGENTAIGRAALFHNTSGSQNIALGVNAGLNLTTGDHNIDIGNAGDADDSDTIRIGATQDRTFIAGIRGTQPPVGIILPVLIDLNGQLGTTVSSRRFKHEIKSIDKESEAILALKPVTFHYKSDQTNTPQFGLVAEEVAEINPDLVVRDADGEIYSVRYDAVNAMLLNEFLKEHRTVQALTSTVAKQEATIAKLQKDFQANAAHQQKQIEALSAGLQNVSAQLEARKPTPQVALNNP